MFEQIQPHQCFFNNPITVIRLSQEKLGENISSSE